jgi:hypothetical protein
MFRYTRSVTVVLLCPTRSAIFSIGTSWSLMIETNECRSSRSRHGGLITGNWETSSLRQYSSLDSSSLATLVQDPAWNHGGLFALLQGLRRLKQIGGDRVDLPEIEWEIT